MDIYREIILDHYKHPRNFGKLETASVVVDENNLSCGDQISMYLEFDGGYTQEAILKNVKFAGSGCAVSQAAASMLTEEVLGQSIKTIMLKKPADIVKMLGIELTPTRLKCALLSLEVLQKGVVAYLDQKQISKA